MSEIKATFKIVSDGFIGTIDRRFWQGTIVVIHDAMEAEQLRRSSSAMEIPNEEEVSPEEAPEEAAPAEEGAPEATEAGLRSQMMSMPGKELQTLAKANSVRYVGVKREKVVDGILAATAKGTTDG